MAQVQGEKKLAPQAEQTIEEAVSELTRRDVVTLSSGKEVTVRICKVRDIPAFIDLVSKLYLDLDIKLGSPEQMEVIIAEKMNDAAAVLKLISNRWDEVVSVLAKLTTLKKEEVEDLDLDDAAELVFKAFKINYVFFMKRILPMLPGVLAERLENVASAGETSSTTS